MSTIFSQQQYPPSCISHNELSNFYGFLYDCTGRNLFSMASSSSSEQRQEALSQNEFYFWKPQKHSLTRWTRSFINFGLTEFSNTFALNTGCNESAPTLFLGEHIHCRKPVSACWEKPSAGHKVRFVQNWTCACKASLFHLSYWNVLADTSSVFSWRLCPKHWFAWLFRSWESSIKCGSWHHNFIFAREQSDIAHFRDFGSYNTVACLVYSKILICLQMFSHVKVTNILTVSSVCNLRTSDVDSSSLVLEETHNDYALIFCGKAAPTC